MEKKNGRAEDCELLGMTKIQAISFIKKRNVKFYQFSGFKVSKAICLPNWNSQMFYIGQSKHSTYPRMGQVRSRKFTSPCKLRRVVFCFAFPIVHARCLTYLESTHRNFGSVDL